MSARLREHLNLPAEISQRISIKTFGSTKENRQSVDVVRLCVATGQGEGVELPAFVVPIICDPLQRQSISEATHTYPHLKGLELRIMVLVKTMLRLIFWLGQTSIGV